MRDDISALMDGELDAGRAAILIQQAARDDEVRDLWSTYHLIGDALRGNVLQPPGIQSRIFGRLAEEPTILSPKPRNAIFASGRSARVGMAIAASVATISVVAWMARQDTTSPAPRMAQTTPAQIVGQTVVEPVPVASIQPANVSEYLLAHEEFSPSSAGYRLATVNTLAPANSAAGR